MTWICDATGLWFRFTGSYRDYDRKQSLIIEKAAGEGKESVLLDMLHIVDFRKMEQINMKTKTTRKVRRVDMGPPPDRRDCMKPAIIGSQRRIVQSHSPLGVSLPKDVNVVVDNFSDSVFSAGDSEQEKMLKLLEFRLVTEKVGLAGLFLLLLQSRWRFTVHASFNRSSILIAIWAYSHFFLASDPAACIFWAIPFYGIY